MSDYRELILNVLKKLTESVDEEHRYEAQFLAIAMKQMAERLKDAEVIGFATLLENEATRLIDQENEAYDNMSYQEVFEQSDAVRSLCIRLFYKENVFSADMNKYEAILEENKDNLVKAEKYKKLKRYLDEKTVITKIYTRMKNDLQPVFDTPNFVMPDEESIKKLYPDYLSEMYRLADKHVKSEIEKANNEVKNQFQPSSNQI